MTEMFEYGELDHAYFNVIELEQQLTQAIGERRSDPVALERAREAADALLEALSPFVARADAILRQSYGLALDALETLDDGEEHAW